MGATGSVSFYNGASGASCSSLGASTLIGTQTLSGGSTAVATTTLAAGSDTIIACYSGDNNYNSSSATLVQTVNKAAPTVSFTGAPANAASGATFNVVATTNASTTAVITASGACTVLGNTVTMTSSTGTCTLTATWAADNNYSGATATQSTTAGTGTITIPAHWDWREQGKVTPVKNQGSSCGSTWVFTPVAAVESKLLILQNVTLDLSEQEPLSCVATSTSNGCNGGAPTDALDYIQSNGIASEASFPYQGTQLACPANLPESIVKISGYHSVAVVSDLTSMIASIKAEIYNNGPVMVYVTVYPDFVSYTSGVYTHTPTWQPQRTRAPRR
jgi:hypothetical protein